MALFAGLALVLLLLAALYRFVCAKLEDRYCAAGDIDAAGKPRPGGKLPGRVVVVGASIQGLLAGASSLSPCRNRAHLAYSTRLRCAL